MMRTTRWRPDTCGCRLVYEWDDAVAQDNRVHTIVSIEAACQAHAALNPVDHFQDVQTENQRKNLSVAEVLKVLPSVRLEEIAWSFDAQRQLLLEVPRATAVEKAQIRAALALQGAIGPLVGADKVTVLP